MSSNLHPSSFRDPDGSIFVKDNQIYRYVFESYRSDLDLLYSSGLYDELTGKYLLVKHVEHEFEPGLTVSGKPVYKILKPELIPFISYPYEWCFSQLKAAAIATLEMQLMALKKGMSLKDATAYNIQFNGTKPVFIDTLSFEAYEENKPWQAYGQFCRHFLGPLLLWRYNKQEIADLSLKYTDGIPLRVVSYCLPFKTRFNFSILSHIHYHSKLEKNFESGAPEKIKTLQLSKTRLLGIITHLKNYIQSLSLDKKGSAWTNYYETFSYSDSGFVTKKNLVASFIDLIKPASILDIGCNAGEFSLLCANKAKLVVSTDSDALVIERMFNKVNEKALNNILPLVGDITNPSPGIGFGNVERTGFLNRGKFDLVLALALVHHVTISNNVPFFLFAKQLADIAPALVIEFVPKEDKQSQRLLVTRKDIFTGYTLAEFINAFEKFFSILQKHEVESSGRILFLMQRHA